MTNLQADMLRKQAADLRHNAQHAERGSDTREELILAAQLEARADRLEGKARVGTHQASHPAEIAARNKANFKRAYSELEAFFSPNR